MSALCARRATAGGMQNLSKGIFMQFTPVPDTYPRDEIIRSGTISDGPDIEIISSRYKGKTFRATGARAKFIPQDGVWHCRIIVIGGGVIKQDGTPGNNEGSREYFDPLGTPTTPAWVREIAKPSASWLSG